MESEIIIHSGWFVILLVSLELQQSVYRHLVVLSRNNESGLSNEIDKKIKVKGKQRPNKFQSHNNSRTEERCCGERIT